MIYRERELELFSLPLSSFQERIDLREKTIAGRLARADSLLFPNRGLWQTDSLSDWFYEPFDTLTTARTYLGMGGFSGKMAEKNVIFDSELPASDSSVYQFSIWMYIDRDLYSRTNVKVEEYDPETGEVIHFFGDAARKFATVFDGNGWALLEFAFQPKRKDSRLRWFFQNERLGDQELWLDELFIRPAHLDVYRRGNSWLWLNNRHYPL